MCELGRMDCEVIIDGVVGESRGHVMDPYFSFLIYIFFGCGDIFCDSVRNRFAIGIGLVVTIRWIVRWPLWLVRDDADDDRMVFSIGHIYYSGRCWRAGTRSTNGMPITIIANHCGKSLKYL